MNSLARDEREAARLLLVLRVVFAWRRTGARALDAVAARVELLAHAARDAAAGAAAARAEARRAEALRAARNREARFSLLHADDDGTAAAATLLCLMMAPFHVWATDERGVRVRLELHAAAATDVNAATKLTLMCWSPACLRWRMETRVVRAGESVHAAARRVLAAFAPRPVALQTQTPPATFFCV